MEEPEGIRLDSEDVREQLEQQRVLAAQLQEKIEQDELQLASKEQQNELLKSRLALLKLRNKTKRNTPCNDKDERKIKNMKDQVEYCSKDHDLKLGGRKQGSGSASKGKINILREQLEQNRLRFERQGLELSEDTRSMEAMVEKLQHALEERDVTIEQLQAGQLPVVYSPSEEDAPEPVDVNTKLLQKEQEVKTLISEVSDLQNVVLELQENLKEKDCVIEARTQAISLLSEDMSRKWRANVDMLEETRQQMQKMQENFISIEAGLNAEIEHLSLLLESNSKKLLQSEQNVKTAEAALNDLSSENAQLLSELASLKETVKITSNLDEANSKVDELSKALSEANKLTVKLKAEHKAKVKALNKQIESLRKESDRSGEVVQLQNHIAELEDEKGNLQLQLIEIEESTAAQEQAIKTLQDTISELQNQKMMTEINLNEFKDQQSFILELELEVQDLRSKLEHTENTLREQLNNTKLSSSAEIDNALQKELEETKSALNEWQLRCEQLERQLADKTDDMFSMVSVESIQAGNGDQPKVDFVPNKMLSKADWVLHQESLELKVKALEESVSEKIMQVQELEAVIKINLPKLDGLEILALSGKTCQNCEFVNKKVIERESQIAELSSSIAELRDRFESLSANQISDEEVLTAPQQLNLNQPQSLGAVENQESDLHRQIIELTGQLELNREECSRLESKLKAQIEKSKKLAVNLKVKTVAVKELEERVARYETVIQDNKAEMEKVLREKQEVMEKWQFEVSEKDAALNFSTESLSSKCAVIVDLESKVTGLQAQLEEMMLELNERCAYIEKLKQDMAEQGQIVGSGRAAELETQVVSIQNQLATEIEEKQAAICKLENFTKQVKLKLAKEKKVRSEMIEKQNEIQQLLDEKSSAVAGLQDEMAKMKSDFKQEKETFDALLKEQQEQIASLHFQLEHEINKLQYASEVVSIDEPIEITQDLQPLPSFESFQNEIEDLCASANSNSSQEILPILEKEKAKTLQELSSSFESLHEQLLSRLQNRPDLTGDRKLFVELKNLVTRVINRTIALEDKIKKIVADSDSVIQKKLQNAEDSIQTLENSLSEARESLNMKDLEESNFKDVISRLEKENLELILQVQQETQKSHELEAKIKETFSQLDTLTQSSNLLQEKLNEKETLVQHLQTRYHSLSRENNELEGQLHYQAEQQKVNMQINEQEAQGLRLEFQKKLQNAEDIIQTLENSLSEARESLNMKDLEESNFKDVISKLEKEKLELILQVQQETQKSHELEAKIKETFSQLDTLTQSSNLLQEKLNEKETLVQHLQTRYHSVSREKCELEGQLHYQVEQQGVDMQIYEQETENLELKIAELTSNLQDVSSKREQQAYDLAQQITGALLKHNKKLSQEKIVLQQKLSDSVSSSSQFQQELALKQDALMKQSATWDDEKNHYESVISDLSHRLKTALEEATIQQSTLCSDVKSGDVDLLHQRLAKQSAEIENYQRRLIQLQMGVPEPSPSSLNFPHREGEDVFQAKEKTLLEGFFSNQSNSSFDGFKQAAPYFEKPAESRNFEVEIQNLNEQLNLLSSDKEDLEAKNYQLQAKFESLIEELNSSKRELESKYTTIEGLECKISELTSALRNTKNSVQQEKINSVNIECDMKEVQWKLENVLYEKEKAENELKALAQKDADERPRIPKTLDTHVSSLQDSGAGFGNDRRTNSQEESRTDESLMESNITQLESELGGMVMSQQENSKKVESAETLLAELCQLRKKLPIVEAERNSAVSQISELQAELKSLSESACQKSDTTNQVQPSSDSDPAITDDDNWEWGADSAHVEVQHQQLKSQPESESGGSVKNLQERIDSLVLENEALEKEKLQIVEDLKTTQVRALKLARKLKDLKTKYDEISDKSRSPDSPLDTLDQAIEEERMKRVQSLEKELQDIQAELSINKADRCRLQKQVDVFSSANDRLMEAKERQDVEVEMWQKRCKDLSNQVQALEWRIQELEESKGENATSSTNPSLKPPSTGETLNAVEIDQLLKENHTWNANYENLMQEYQKLRAQCLTDSEQRIQVDSLVSQQESTIERLEHEKTYFQDIYDSLKMDYESACAQLASKQSNNDENLELVTKTLEELKEKLENAEKELQETTAQLHAVSADSKEFQARCSQLSHEKKELLLKLEESRNKLESNHLEINRLQESIRVLEGNSSNQSSSVPLFTPLQEHSLSQEASLKESPASAVLKWNSIVCGQVQPTEDVFESIANNTTQALEEQLALKDRELMKERIMIESLKRTMEESEQEWGQLIEYHKNQLEVTKGTISELQAQLKSETSSLTGAVDMKSDKTELSEQYQELQHVIFGKEKEMESLQISLAVSEEARRKLEEDLKQKEIEIVQFSKEMPSRSIESSSLAGQSSPSNQSSNLSVSSMSGPVMSSPDQNLLNELDQALYMLHERDVRCEELTLELTQLLEERDGLQLRLSNAIRTNEELRERLRQVLSSQPDDFNSNAMKNLAGQEQYVPSVTAESSRVLPNHSTEGLPLDLQTKLTELRTIGYSHDKRLRDDSEYRHQQQMRLLSPSPQAVSYGNPNDLGTSSDVTSAPTVVTHSPIVDASPADQSTSNESQGSLLGWLWGRS